MKMTPEKLAETVERLKRHAKRETKPEDEYVVDCVGSNVDDAYDMGLEDGETFAARETLELLELLEIVPLDSE